MKCWNEKMKDEYPERDEFVIATVKEVKDFGAFVILDEYDNKEGFIHVAEVSSGWIKYIRDYIREGQKIVCKVLNVDIDKGHIDLSFKQVNEHQRREKIRQWKNEQKAEKLLEFVSKEIGKSKQQCYEEFAYDLINDFGNLYNSFEQCAINENILKEKKYNGEWIEIFVKVAKENIIRPIVKVSGILELYSQRPDGINHIKYALKKAVENKNTNINIQYIGAPKYRIVVSAQNYKIAEEELKKSVDKVIKCISPYGKGNFIRGD